MKRGLLIIITLVIGINLCGQSMTDGVRRIYYDSIEDAESKLLKYYQERQVKYGDHYDNDFNSALPYKMFTDLILHEPMAYYYGFERLIKVSESDKGTRRPLRIINSPDGKIRLYTWDEHGGTMTNYSGITSISNDGSVFSYATQKDELGENLIDGFIDIASGAYQINVIPGSCDSPIYLIHNHSSGSTSTQLQTISAFSINGNKIEPQKVFQSSNGLVNDISIIYEPGHYYTSSIQYNYPELIIPETRPNDLNPHAGNLFTGRLHTYLWNQTHFEPNGIIYIDDGLNAKLLDFSYNILQTSMDKWQIRIDKMPNGSYRYASWKTPKRTADEPDLIINNGHEDINVDTRDEYKKAFKYIFQNNEYFYIVSWISDSGNFSKTELIVKKHDKVLMRILKDQ